jgi:ribosome recycling factor
MQLNNIYKAAEEKMAKAIEALEHEFTGLRTGRAAVGFVDNVQVEAYGSRMPLKQVATVSTPDARTLMIQPFDKSMLAAIEKSILSANLGMTPSNDGKLIRLNIPPLTEERRKDLVKMAKKMAEDSRISIRNSRRHANDDIKKTEKDKEISEDDREKATKHVQEITDKYVKEIDTLLAKKEKDIMEI